MANNFHRAKLCEGALAWNLWRDSNPRVVPDLEDVALTPSQRQFGLEDWGPIDLRRARLSGADLRYATLTAADLEEAVLAKAQFTNARLERANLSRADLTDAVFDDADLSGARLDAAILDGAQLAKARNLTQSQINRCVGDRATALPPDLEAPANWLRRDLRAASPANAREAAGSPGADEDPAKKAADEIFKTIARARDALRPPADRRAQARAGAGRHFGASTGHGASARSGRLAVYLLGTAIAAAAAIVLFWTQLTASAPLPADASRGPAAATLDARETWSEAEEATRPSLFIQPSGPDAAGAARPADAAPALLAVAPQALDPAPPAAGARLFDAEPPSEARETPWPSVQTAREAAGETPGRPRSSPASGGRAKPPALKRAPARRAARPSAARVAGDRGAAHPFTPPPCKVTLECRAGLAFCGC